MQRILAEGHDVGNHTFTHPNLGEMPDALVDARDQRHAATVRGLDRPIDAAVPARPISATPSRPRRDEIAPIEAAQSMGYFIGRAAGRPGRLAAASGRRPSSSGPWPRSRIQTQISAARSSCCTTPAATARAPSRRCRSSSMRCGPRATSFVPVSELAGLTRDQAMPPVPATLAGQARRSAGVHDAWLARPSAHRLFIVAIGSASRGSLFLCGIALRNRRARPARAAARAGARAAAVGADPRLQRGQGHRALDRPHPGERLSQSRSHRHRRRLDRRHGGPRCGSTSPTIRASRC